MSGKTATAPCGHVGETIIGNYVACRTPGCGGRTQVNPGWTMGVDYRDCDAAIVAQWTIPAGTATLGPTVPPATGLHLHSASVRLASGAYPGMFVEHCACQAARYQRSSGGPSLPWVDSHAHRAGSHGYCTVIYCYARLSLGRWAV